MSSIETEGDVAGTTPPPSAETIVKLPKAAPFNAICLLVANSLTKPGKAEPGSGYIVQTKKGGLAVITAAHVLVNPKEGIDATKAPGSLEVNAGTYVKDGNPPQLLSVSPRLKAVSCVVHDKFDPDPANPAGILSDIGIAFLAPEPALVGAPLRWAEDKGNLPKSPVPAKNYSVIGHNASRSGDKFWLARQRMIRVTPTPIADTGIFAYTSSSRNLGYGQSGAPVMIGWSANPADMKATTVYGHHVKSSVKAAEAGPDSTPTAWFGAMRYTSKIAAWLVSKGL
jgi:hypothetical protein